MKIMDSVFSIFGGKYFNQNLICLILAYIGVFFARKYEYDCLCYIIYFFLIIAMFSTIITLGFYTWEYCVRKCMKAKCHVLRCGLSEKIVEEPSNYRSGKKTRKILPKDIIAWN